MSPTAAAMTTRRARLTSLLTTLVSRSSANNRTLTERSPLGRAGYAINAPRKASEYREQRKRFSGDGLGHRVRQDHAGHPFTGFGRGLIDQVESRIESVQGSVECDEGSEDGSDGRRKAQPEVDQQTEQISEHAGVRFHTGTQPLNEKLAQGALEKIFVGGAASGGDVQQCVPQLPGIPLADCKNEARQGRLLKGIDSSYRSEVDKGKRPVAAHQNVARVRVGVKNPTDHDLAKHRPQEPAREFGPVQTAFGNQRVCGPQGHPVHPFEDQDPRGG